MEERQEFRRERELAVGGPPGGREHEERAAGDGHPEQKRIAGVERGQGGGAGEGLGIEATVAPGDDVAEVGVFRIGEGAENRVVEVHATDPRGLVRRDFGDGGGATGERLERAGGRGVAQDEQDGRAGGQSRAERGGGRGVERAVDDREGGVGRGSGTEGDRVVGGGGERAAEEEKAAGGVVRIGGSEVVDGDRPRREGREPRVVVEVEVVAGERGDVGGGRRGHDGSRLARGDVDFLAVELECASLGAGGVRHADGRRLARPGAGARRMDAGVRPCAGADEGRDDLDARGPLVAGESGGGGAALKIAHDDEDNGRVAVLAGLVEEVGGGGERAAEVGGGPAGLDGAEGGERGGAAFRGGKRPAAVEGQRDAQGAVEGRDGDEVVGAGLPDGASGLAADFLEPGAAHAGAGVDENEAMDFRRGGEGGAAAEERTGEGKGEQGDDEAAEQEEEEVLEPSPAALGGRAGVEESHEAEGHALAGVLAPHVQQDRPGEGGEGGQEEGREE